MATITGNVRQERRIGGTVTAGARITTGTVQRAALPGGAPYEGDYEAIPDKMAQVFPTQNKTMRQDFTVAGVPTYRVSNPEGGTTLIIGGNKNGQ